MGFIAILLIFQGDAKPIFVILAAYLYARNDIGQDDFIRRFSLSDFVVVADSGLMNENNISLLRSAGYKHVIGARIKNESTELKK